MNIFLKMTIFNPRLIILMVFMVMSVVTSHRLKKRGTIVFSHRKFYSYDQIVDNMGKLDREYEDTQRIEYGNKTFEGRQMYYQHLQAKRGLYPVPNPYIVVVGGLNGNERMSSAAVLYFAQQLLERFRYKDSVAYEMLINFDWIVIPVANPDGYEKARSSGRYFNYRLNTHPSKTGHVNCNGVDINKNFMFSTMPTDYQCMTHTYSGPSAFSEVESQGIRDLILEKGKWFAGFMSVHEKGMSVVTPPTNGDWWTLLSNNPRLFSESVLKETTKVATKIADAMTEVNNQNYKYQDIGDVFYGDKGDIPGSAVDWVQYKRPGTYTFATYLGPESYVPDTTRSSPYNIVKAGEELFAALKTMTENMDDDYLATLRSRFRSG